MLLCGLRRILSTMQYLLFYFIVVTALHLLPLTDATQSNVSLIPRPSWWSCVRDMPKYYLHPEVSPDPFASPIPTWLDNPCGFVALSISDIRELVFFTAEDRSVAFAGDSTALRAYVYAVNTFLPPLNIPVISKVAAVPPRMDHKGVDTATQRTVKMTFYNMRYVSIAEDGVAQAFQADGGAFVVTVGNWDLNWKLQKKSPMPYLGGRVHDYRVAQRYWTTYTAKMMFSIFTHLQARRAAPAGSTQKRVPLMVIREQFLLNCAASRFQGKKGYYRQCAPLLRPIVVPMYRRVLSALAWTLNIPVIRMDHIFVDSYKYCGMGDGLHLQMNCMMTEQQHIWNVYTLLRRQNVTQGDPEWVRRALHLNAGVPITVEHFAQLATTMLDAKAYQQWLHRFSMVPPNTETSLLNSSTLPVAAELTVDLEEQESTVNDSALAIILAEGDKEGTTTSTAAGAVHRKGEDTQEGGIEGGVERRKSAALTETELLGNGAVGGEEGSPVAQYTLVGLPIGVLLLTLFVARRFRRRK